MSTLKKTGVWGIESVVERGIQVRKDEDQINVSESGNEKKGSDRRMRDFE